MAHAAVAVVSSALLAASMTTNILYVWDRSQAAMDTKILTTGVNRSERFYYC